MKRLIALSVCAALLIGALAGCSGGGTSASSGTNSTAGSSQSSQPVTLNFMLNSPELTDQYKAMVTEYKKVAPSITINMTIIQNDYQTVLKSKLNSGDIPDLFMSSAYNDNKVYRDYTYDLTNESFMKEIDPQFLQSVKLDGKVTGYPFLVQSHSFIYNKEMFQQAGITALPATLDEYKSACEKLQAKGIQPLSSGFAEWWVLPQMTYPSMSDAYKGDYSSLFTDVKSGKLKFGDLPQVDFALDLIDLVKKYSGSKPMESTADMQVSDFANGKVAMIHQGSWEEDSIRKINSNIDMGYLDAPRLDGKSVVAVDTNLTMRVSKDSKNLKDVLSFLDWLTTSDYGKKWIPQVIKQISPQKGAASPDTQLAKETAQAEADSSTCQWWIFNGPDGIEQPFGTAFQNYAAGTATRQQTKDALTKVFVDAFNAEG
ncbi:ABC transporter substrate-binding protein [Caproicibacter fermentans]|uniref:Extracellular solute-binding protein n=1 Tax=Caproicibacter fermentans TaxID=2576756 RepID=A0A7G8T835_9FIRM|nr:extracellular solute-binding protein [Caproicibacter fermentans]QNK39776.1 extracellular solute-binding protein [Caproicibacter fermentans]